MRIKWTSSQAIHLVPECSLFLWTGSRESGSIRWTSPAGWPGVRDQWHWRLLRKPGTGGPGDSGMVSYLIHVIQVQTVEPVLVACKHFTFCCVFFLTFLRRHAASIYSRTVHHLISCIHSFLHFMHSEMLFIKSLSAVYFELWLLFFESLRYDRLIGFTILRVLS